MQWHERGVQHSRNEASSIQSATKLLGKYFHNIAPTKAAQTAPLSGLPVTVTSTVCSPVGNPYLKQGSNAKDFSLKKSSLLSSSNITAMLCQRLYNPAKTSCCYAAQQAQHSVPDSSASTSCVARPAVSISIGIERHWLCLFVQLLW